MLKFIAKVWIAGEVNDLRRARKQRKKQEKLNKMEQKRLMFKNICEVEEELRKPQNRQLKKEYEKYQNGKAISLVVFILSIVLSAFLPPLFGMSVISLIYMIICVIKERYIINKISIKGGI